MKETLFLNKISRRKFLKISSLSAGALLAGLLEIKAATPGADLVLKNGKIITMDHQASIKQAVAVRQGRIIDVGSTEEYSCSFWCGSAGVSVIPATNSSLAGY